MITKDDIDAALARIRPHVHETPLVTSMRLGNKAGGIKLMLKCESMQRTGSFKARGALNAMMQLSHAERAKGVVTVSAGNHGQALAWAAATVGAQCTVVMHESSSPAKVEATKGYGAKVELVGGERVRAFERAQQIASEGVVLVHPFEDPRVQAGQGTVGLEILAQCKEFDVLVVPIGGGGLISGVATAIKTERPNVRVVGVEPIGAATMKAAMDAGSPQTISPKSIADGLSAPMVGALTFATAKKYMDELVLVSDEEIASALGDLLGYAKLLAEPAGAAALAALITGKITLERGARVVAIVSGGNVDLDRLKTLL